MMGTAVLLLIPFLLFLIGYYTIARNETKATLQAHRRGSNGTRPTSAQVGAFRSVVPSSMTSTVGASFLRTKGSAPTQKSSTPETFLEALRARSNGHHPPLQPEAWLPVALIETPQPLQEPAPHEFPLGQEVEERFGALETSEPIRSFSFSDWLRRPCCRHSP